MGRSPYQGEKRRKELARLKKQEEKRQKRFNKKHGSSESAEGAPEGVQPEGTVMDSSEAGVTPEGTPVDQTSQPEQAPQTSEEGQQGGQPS